MPFHADVRPGSSLTERELAVLRLASDGLTVKEIGPKLGITAKTAKNYLEHAYMRLGVHSRVEAFRAMGWLTVEEDTDYGVLVTPV